MILKTTSKKIQTVLFLIISLFLFSCNKENTSSKRDILMQFKWNQYQHDEQKYVATSTGYELTNDTSYTVDQCIQNSKYQFLKDSVLTFSRECIVNPVPKRGKWYLDDNNHLLGIIHEVINGQTYYFGVDGSLIEIDHQHFKVQKTRVLSFTQCDSTGFCSMIKDSTVTIDTYKN